MAEAPPAEGEESANSKKKLPPLVKRSDSVIARDKQSNFSRGEVEDTIKRISSHRGIIGTVIVDKHCVPLRSSMDKASTQQYAAFITPLVHRAQMICLDHDPMNPMTMFRIRTNTTEVIVTPDKEHYLIAVQKTGQNIVTSIQAERGDKGLENVSRESPSSDSSTDGLSIQNGVYIRI